MSAPFFHHGTPFTPRPALENVLAGRGACVSFYRPDDVEVVERVCPTIMFRSRRILCVAGRAQARRGMGSAGARPASLLRLARAAAFQRWPVGGGLRRSGRAIAVQRCFPERLAFRSGEGRAGLAHGRTDRAARPPLRALRSSLSRLDRRVRPVDRQDPQRSEGRRMRCLSPADGRGRRLFGQQMAPAPHDARLLGGLRLPVDQRRRDQRRPERVAVRQSAFRCARRPVARTASVCRQIGGEA